MSPSSPSQEVSARELLQQFRNHLTPDEKQLAELRVLGYEWSEIAAQLGGSPEALRKRLARAVQRVARQLGLEGWEND